MFLNYTLIFILVILIYCCFLYKYLIKKYGNNYDNFIKILKNVKNNDTNFMNFGYWDDNCNSLSEANKNLCDFVINQCNIKNNKFLDIGCGYGDQDFYWNEKYNYDIIAVDISKKQIDYANEKAKFINNIKFIEGSATKLPFPDKSFNNIICLESAFHYNPRNLFFKECYRLLDNNSELIIADIVLKDNEKNFKSSFIINFFRKILSVPKENLIKSCEYIKQLEKEGFKVNKINISNETFKPYFNYFYNNHKFSFYIYNKIMDILIKNIDYIPFEYYVFKCIKI